MRRRRRKFFISVQINNLLNQIFKNRNVGPQYRNLHHFTGNFEIQFFQIIQRLLFFKIQTGQPVKSPDIKFQKPPARAIKTHLSGFSQTGLSNFFQQNRGALNGNLRQPRTQSVRKTGRRVSDQI